MTGRVIAFSLALCVVIGGAVACLGWYSRSAYFVTLSKGRVTIFQGRPGGVLWFQPTLALRTPYGPSSVPSYYLGPLATGQVEPSLADARLYVNRMVSEKRESEAVTPAGARGAPRHKLRRPARTSPAPRTTPPTTARGTVARKARTPKTST